MSPLRRALPLAILLTAAAAHAADEDAPNRRPVAEVGPVRLPLPDGGSLPLYLSADWSQPMPGIDRAVVVLHGRLRNADTYLRRCDAHIAVWA